MIVAERGRDLYKNVTISRTAILILDLVRVRRVRRNVLPNRKGAFLLARPSNRLDLKSADQNTTIHEHSTFGSSCMHAVPSAGTKYETWLSRSAGDDCYVGAVAISHVFLDNRESAWILEYPRITRPR